MVHVRFNETEPNPNPHINFVVALHAPHSEDTEAARQLLRSLAAQVRPVMKSHGFVVNSFEEYEHNQVFSGRNWNNGEIIELVLRRQDGSFLPAYWLLSTLCHELAHIKHMNHGPAFQALWLQLRTEVRALQDRGYYGDGYWSSGRRLADSTRVAGEGIEPGDLPEYMCGGAHTRARPTSVRRFRSERCAATKRRVKAGSRVTTRYAFVGEGSKLAEGPVGSSGTGFRKQARSKRAREERAAAATERRIRTLQNQSNASTSGIQSSKAAGSEDSNDDIEIIETDAERRQVLLKSGEQENDLLRLDKTNAWKEFQHEFNFGYKPSLNNDAGCDLPIASGSIFTSLGSGSEKESRQPFTGSPILTASKLSERPSPYRKGKTPSEFGLGSKLVQSEIQFRRREALGMTSGPGRMLDSDDEIIVSELRRAPHSSTRRPQSTMKNRLARSTQWACLVCTLLNESDHLACAACGTTRSKSTWKE